MRRTRILASTSLALLLAMTSSCGAGTDTPDSEGLQVLSERGIDEIAFISRSKDRDVGDVFNYTSFSVAPKSANIMRMRTVSGGGNAEPITPFGTGDWPKADIMAMDVSFDGQEIVFSARLEGDSTYGLYRIRRGALVLPARSTRHSESPLASSTGALWLARGCWRSSRKAQARRLKSGRSFRPSFHARPPPCR